MAGGASERPRSSCFCATGFDCDSGTDDVGAAAAAVDEPLVALAGVAVGCEGAVVLASLDAAAAAAASARFVSLLGS